MRAIPKCWICGGSVLGDACLMCGRTTAPERISMGEALLSNAAPEADVDGITYGQRQSVPVETTMQRVAAWLRGEAAS